MFCIGFVSSRFTPVSVSLAELPHNCFVLLHVSFHSCFCTASSASPLFYLCFARLLVCCTLCSFLYLRSWISLLFLAPQSHREAPQRPFEYIQSWQVNLFSPVSTILSFLSIKAFTCFPAGTSLLSSLVVYLHGYRSTLHVPFTKEHAGTRNNVLQPTNIIRKLTIYVQYRSKDLWNTCK